MSGCTCMVYCIVEVATNVCRAFRRIVVLHTCTCHALCIILQHCNILCADSEKMVYGLATCQCNRTFQGLQFSWGWQGMQLCPFYKLLYGFPCKKLQFFSPLDHTSESILCFLYLINVCSFHLKYQFLIYNVVLQIEV